ncbi:MAG TPA: hypothetical protein VKB86_00255 [Pyrinomonadaceae bacterium]|nr:hypothetical protein [Pyrinomonadaceae bacterium]
MSIDERIEARLTRQGVDLQSDEGAMRFQEELERELERERKRAWQTPPQVVERVNHIRI